MKITLDDLVDVGACEEQRNVFKELFGQEVTVTLALCMQYAEYFDWDWAASAFFQRPDYRIYSGDTADARSNQAAVCDAAYAQFRADGLNTDRLYNEGMTAARTVRDEAITRAGGLTEPGCTEGVAMAERDYSDAAEALHTARCERRDARLDAHSNAVEGAYRALRAVQAREFFNTCERIDARKHN